MVAPLQSAGNQQSASNPAATFGTNLSSGTKLLAFAVNSGTSGGVTAVKDGSGNSFSELTSLTNANGDAFTVWEFDTIASQVGTKPTITATCTTPANGTAMVIAEVPGLVKGSTAAACYDGNAGTASAYPVTGTWTPSFGTYVSSASGEFLVAVCMDSGDAGSTTTGPTATYTAFAGNQNGNSSANCNVFYKASTGGTESAGTWSVTSGSNGYGTVLVAFKVNPAYTVTATNSDGSPLIYLQAEVLTGAQESGGASAALGNGATGTTTLTPNFSGSFIAQAINDATSGGTAPTPATNNKTLTVAAGTDTVEDATVSIGLAAQYYSGTVTGGTGVTVGWSNEVGGTNAEMAAYEVPNATGHTWAEDGSTPAWAHTSTTNTITSASFNPPPGSVLVAVVSVNYTTTNNPTTTITVSSSPALTWTARKFSANASSNGGAAIFTATVPGAAASSPQTQRQPGGRQYRRRFRRTQMLAPPQAAVSAPTPVTLADVAAAVDDQAGQFTVAAAVPEADVAGAVDSLTVQVAVPLAEVGAAVDDQAANFTVAAAVPLADVAGAVDGLTSGVPVAEGDVAGAVDSLSVAVAVPLAEVGAAVDTETIAAAVPLADVGAGVDSVAAVVSISEADVAGAVDSVAIGAAVPEADVAGAVDSLAVQVAVPLADVAGAVESITAGVPIAEAEVAGAVDSLSVAVAVPLPDTAGAVDSASVTATLSLADVAGAADTIAAGSPTFEPDVAGAVEALAVQAAVPAADVAGAADTIAITVPLPYPDVGGAVDTLSVLKVIPQAEVAGAVDSLVVQVAVPLADVAGAADSPLISNMVALADVAGSADALFVVSGIHPTGTVYFTAKPDRPRWRAEQLPGRWRPRPGGSRWNHDPELARWKAQPAPSRWRAMLQTFDPISAASVEEVNIRWTSDLDGTVTDPTIAPLIVQAGFAVSSGNPLAPSLPSQWYTGSWLAGGTGKGYVSQHPVGAGTTGPTLTAGKYDVWGYITGTPESPKKFVGVLTVY